MNNTKIFNNNFGIEYLHELFGQLYSIRCIFALGLGLKLKIMYNLPASINKEFVNSFSMTHYHAYF